MQVAAHIGNYNHLAGAAVADDDGEAAFQLKAKLGCIAVEVSVKQLCFVAGRQAVCMEPCSQGGEPASSSFMVDNGGAGAVVPWERCRMKPVCMKLGRGLGGKQRLGEVDPMGEGRVC